VSRIAQTPFTAFEVEAPDRQDQSNIKEILLWLSENISAYEWKPRPKKKGSVFPEGGPCFDLHFTDKVEAAAFKQRWVGAMRTSKRRM
jgi:hypothetical protein